jgi:hypothetical protein
MVLNLPTTLKLEVVLVHQGVGDGLGVLRTDNKVVYIRCDVVIMIVNMSQSDIWFSLTREEAHVLKTCGEVFMPAST